MKKILIVLIAVAMVSLLNGCIMLSMQFNEDGFSFGIEGDIPDMPSFDYEKEIK